MRQALTELQIMSNNATVLYLFAGNIIVTGTLVAIGIGCYDWWMNRHPRR